MPAKISATILQSSAKWFRLVLELKNQQIIICSHAVLASKLGAPDSRPLADFLPTISIKAKDFAAEMTSVNVQQKDLHGMPSIEKEHVDNNTAVRNMLLSRGIVPEQLPAGEEVKKVERRLSSEEKKILKKK